MVCKRAADYSLIGKRGALDDRYRQIARCARFAQPRNDARQLRDAHVEHDGVMRLRERAPVERLIVERVSGRDRHALREVAMRERNTRDGRRTQGRSDSWHDHVWNAMRAQHLDLFTAAAEDERIAALETGHPQALRA